MKTPEYIVYGLLDPRSRLIRYVGCSSKGMRRPKQHGYPSFTRGRSRKAIWIRSLIAAGVLYETVIVERVDSFEAMHAAERWWIAYGRACGWDLTNLTDGGEGALGYVPSPEAIEKLRRAGTGRRASAESRARMCIAQQNRAPISDDTRERIRQSKLGKPRSPETVEKVRQSKIGKTLSAEHRAKISVASKADWARRRAEKDTDHGSD